MQKTLGIIASFLLILTVNASVTDFNFTVPANQDGFNPDAPPAGLFQPSPEPTKTTGEFDFPTINWNTSMPAYPQAIMRPSSAVDDSFNLYVVGGMQGPVNTARRFNVNTGVWQSLPNLPANHANCGGVFWVDGNGIGTDSSFFMTLGSYQPTYTPNCYRWWRATNTWDVITFPGIYASVITGSMGGAIGDTIYMIVRTTSSGGDTLWKYCPRSNTWTGGEPPPDRLNYYGAACVYGGRLWQLGGWSARQTFQVYRPGAGWTLLSSAPTNVGGNSGYIAGHNGQIFGWGGGSSWTPWNGCAVFDTVTLTWVPEANLPLAVGFGAYGALLDTVTLVWGLHNATGQSTSGSTIHWRGVWVVPLDAQVVSITAPTGTVNQSTSLNPQATIINNSSTAQSIPVRFTISDGYADDTTLTLNAGQDTIIDFDLWTANTIGNFQTRCSTGLVGDALPINDTLSGSVVVQSSGGPSGNWEAMTDVPSAPSGKNPKSGSCLRGLEATGLLYFLKASNQPDFYAYDPATNTWAEKETIPKGEKGLDYSDGKYPKRGAAMEAYEPGKCLYVVRGNNRLGFWKYQADTLGMGDTIGWSKLATIPAGAKRCKYGTGLTLVEKGGNDYLFLMKGAKTSEFYLYDIENDSWTATSSPPVGASGKTGYKKGSIMAYDGSEWVYILQGYYGSFFKYNVEQDSYVQLSQYNYKIHLNREGRKKKFKDGASMVYYNDNCYCLKGGNTVEVWKYATATDSWVQMPENWDVPLGPTGRKKVKDGGGMTMFANYFWATKGKNTPEFYRHGLPLSAPAMVSYLPTNEGTMGKKVNLGDFNLTITPNPAINVAAVRYNLPVAGPVTFKVYNVTGALVKSHTIAEPTKDGVFLINELPAGVYILRFNSGDIRVNRKLILER
jgi:hypothetical protein